MFICHIVMRVVTYKLFPDLGNTFTNYANVNGKLDLLLT